jgi:hypothetical protein
MRAHGRDGQMGKRFAIVIAVVAAGAMALGAQTAASGVDRLPPDLQLSGDKTQNPQEDRFCDSQRCDVIVEVSCGDEACTERARGKLTNVKNHSLHPDGPIVVAPGKTIKRTGPEMAKKAQRRQIRKALDEGKNVRAKVTVRATDAAGNVATAERTIRLVRAQTAAAPQVVKADTELTITAERLYLEGGVYSKVRKCMEGRRVVLFERRPGVDRKVGSVRSHVRARYGRGDWYVTKSSLGLQTGGHRFYARVKPKMSDRFVCRADRSETRHAFVR